MIHIPGFAEFSLKVTGSKHRRSSVQLSKISDFFETESGFTMICLGESNTFIVNEPYDEVKRRIHCSLTHPNLTTPHANP